MSSINLTHHFLIAMPSMADPYFAKTLTYICEHNDQGALGLVVNRPIESLRVALRAVQPLQPSAVLVWPVDLPHVRVATVDRVLEAHRRTKAAIVVPTFGERRGHPVIWGSALFEELLMSRRAQEEGARAVLRAHQAEITAVPVDDPAVIDAVNTPEDYERLVREWNRDIY